tara:strand:+ start:1201 stop:1533 length:333 start_codon:yes stop_codon:yes gene_type:complete
MKKQERHFHKSFYEILEKCTKAELITRLENSDKEVRKERWKLDMPGEYQIRILKNKKEVQKLNFTWDDNPHGARWDEVKDLEHSLMAAYQDYESIVESFILIKNDWDERR